MYLDPLFETSCWSLQLFVTLKNKNHPIILVYSNSSCVNNKSFVVVDAFELSLKNPSDLPWSPINGKKVIVISFCCTPREKRDGFFHVQNVRCKARQVDILIQRCNLRVFLSLSVSKSRKKLFIQEITSRAYMWLHGPKIEEDTKCSTGKDYWFW